jgi:hypothetical protein
MITKNQEKASQPVNSSLAAYVEKARAQIQEGKAKLDQIQAKAKEKQAQAEAGAIYRLKATKQNIDRKVQDLKTTSDAHLAHAKADIDADISAFKASVDALHQKVSTYVRK